MGLDAIFEGNWNDALEYFSKIPQFANEQLKLSYFDVIIKEVKKASIFCTMTKFKDMLTDFDLKTVSEMTGIEINETEQYLKELKNNNIK